MEATDTMSVSTAADLMRAGGVVAYPTEYCFGLGCDPRNEHAVQRILSIKQRSVEQGLILIAAELEQVHNYAELDQLPTIAEIKQSWPGPVTWVLPALADTPPWITGQHKSVAMRVTAHALCQSLCIEFGGAIVSTSANRHGQPAAVSVQEVARQLGDEVDLILDGPLANDDSNRSSSSIRDARSGETLR